MGRNGCGRDGMPGTERDGPPLRSISADIKLRTETGKASPVANNNRRSGRAALSVCCPPHLVSPPLSPTQGHARLTLQQPSASMSATPPQLLLTNLPAETLSSIVLLLLRPIDALRFSQTCQILRELAAINEHGLWTVYVNKAGPLMFSMTTSPAPVADALHGFLELVKQSTCSPEHKWHPAAARASGNPQVEACEACIDARLYTSAGTLGSDARQALLVRALKREGITLRSDSRLCSGFICSGYGYIPDIVQTM